MGTNKKNQFPVVSVTNYYNNTTVNIEPVLRLINESACGKFEEFAHELDDLIRELSVTSEMDSLNQARANTIDCLFNMRDAFAKVSIISENQKKNFKTPNNRFF